MKTHFTESSEHIVSHRLNDELFMRMPLKEFGGLGKFGRWNSSMSTELNPWTSVSEYSKFSSVIPANESADALKI